MKNSKDLQYEPELQFFLPQKQGESRYWSLNGSEQMLYAEFCRFGMNLIANEVSIAVKNSEDLDVKSLYKIAAEVRMKTARFMMAPSNHIYRYGFPQVIGYGLYDQVAKKNDRWGEHYSKVKFDLVKLEGNLLDGAFIKEKYGDEINFKLGRSGRNKVVQAIYNDQFGDIELGKIIYDPGGNEITFAHAPIDSRDRLFEVANNSLKKAISSMKSGDNFTALENIADMNRFNFHNAPLILGSQSSAMMVMGGVIKGLGYKIQPIESKYEPFIDCEIIPRSDYNRDFASLYLKKLENVSPNALFNSFVPKDIFKLKGFRWGNNHEKLSSVTANAFGEIELLENFFAKISGSHVDFKIAEFEFSSQKLSINLDQSMRPIGQEKISVYQQAINWGAEFLGKDLYLSAVGLGNLVEQGFSARK